MSLIENPQKLKEERKKYAGWKDRIQGVGRGGVSSSDYSSGSYGSVGGGKYGATSSEYYDDGNDSPKNKNNEKKDESSDSDEEEEDDDNDKKDGNNKNNNKKPKKDEDDSSEEDEEEDDNKKNNIKIKNQGKIKPKQPGKTSGINIRKPGTGKSLSAKLIYKSM